MTGNPLYQQYRPTPQQVERYGETITRTYEMIDRWLGRALESIDDSTLVVLVSDHGAAAGYNRRNPTASPHHPDGIYLISGPTVRPPDEESPGMGPVLQQVDFVPLLLAHLGLAVARDMPGTVPSELMPCTPQGDPMALPEAIASYDPEDDRVDEEAVGEDVMEQLRSLGYVD